MILIFKTAFKFTMMIIIQYLLLFFTLFSLFDNYNVALEFTNRLAIQPAMIFIMLVIGIFGATSESI